MTNMRVFQIQKGEVLIINDEKQYSDTVENFKLDSGLSLDNINEVIYDNYQECCVINKAFLQYPNNNFDSYIDNIDIYIKAKEKREYVPPVEPTEEEKQKEARKKLDDIYNEKFNKKDDEIINAIVILRDNEYAEQLRQERTILTQEYAEKRGAL